MRRVEQFHEKILKYLDLSKDVDDEELIEIIHQVLKNTSLLCYAEIFFLYNFVIIYADVI